LGHGPAFLPSRLSDAGRRRSSVSEPKFALIDARRHKMGEEDWWPAINFSDKLDAGARLLM
jgi:hypothetical protein